MMTVSKDNGSNFQWITKTRAYSRSDNDVSVSIGSPTKSGVVRALFTFRNKKAAKFKTEYIMFGIDGDRLYFCEADPTVGYKLSKCTCEYSRYAQCQDEALVDWARKHVGDYRLDQDSKSELYYINAERVDV